MCTNSVRLCRVEHGGGSGDEREQLGVSPLVSGQIPPGVNHLEADQSIGQRLDGQEGGWGGRVGGVERYSHSETTG